MIEEYKGADHLPMFMRQCAPHLKAIAEIAGARNDDQIERVAGPGVTENGIIGRKPAHGKLLCRVGSTTVNALALILYDRDASLRGLTPQRLYISFNPLSGRNRTSARFPKFVHHRSAFVNELRKAKGTSKSRILVPLFDLKSLRP